MASKRRNTRQNLDGRQTTPVTDPEKILKVRGSLKPTPVVYQLKYPQLMTKSSFKPSTSCNPLFDTKDLTSNYFEVRSETHPITSVVNKGKSLVENSFVVNISSTL
jgi:hypothetical protein